MIPEELRSQAAARLGAVRSQVPQLTATIGFDGFVDEILRLVHERQSLTEYTTVPTIGALAQRLANAAGKSTNIEMVVERVKLGGNGPIMGNALCAFGLKLNYIGCLGYPTVHPVFRELAKRANVVSICEPGHTDALEFEDGKVMMGKHQTLRDVNWANISKRVGVPKLKKLFTSSHLVGFVNWTMLTQTSEIWKQMQSKVIPKTEPKQKAVAFFDLADPEKRTLADRHEALELIGKFSRYYRVTLGLNQKEEFEMAKVLGISMPDESRASVRELAEKIFAALKIERLVVHPTAYAVAVDAEGSAIVDGPFCEKPVITTGAGDHFNAGFCLGNLLGLDKETALLIGVSTSGFYVRTGRSPSVGDIIKFLKNWPAK